jgi:hypothetical protein
MFCVERTFVNVGTKKSSQVYVKLENFSLGFIDAEDYAASEKWQKIFIYIVIIALFLIGYVAQR